MDKTPPLPEPNDELRTRKIGESIRGCHLKGVINHRETPPVLRFSTAATAGERWSKIAPPSQGQIMILTRIPIEKAGKSLMDMPGRGVGKLGFPNPPVQRHLHRRLWNSLEFSYLTMQKLDPQPENLPAELGTYWQDHFLSRK